MKNRIILFLLCLLPAITIKAGNGDSIFNMQYVHTLKVTFPYPAFYDSLLWSYNNDTYLKVDIDFNSEHLSGVGIKAKGNSSFNNPSQKKSFKLDMNEFVSGLDLHGLKKLNFNNGFKDPSFLREKITNDFLRAHDLPASRVTFCNVYFNNQLWGLYAIVEEVDDEFCDHWFNNHDGNLFKGDPHGDLRWKGASTQSLYESSYELKNNSTANNWTDLISLIDIINNTPVNTLHTALDSKLNTARFVKHWAAMDLFSSLDSYIGSGHNYYIYHDTISDRFEWIAWDNNESFGSFKNSLSEAQLLNLDMYYLSQPTNRPLCNQMLTNPVYHAMYNDAFCALQQEWNNAILGPSMDSLHAKIQSSVYADTKKFYSNGAFDSSLNYTINSSGPGGIAVFGLKSFITSRNAAIPSILTTHGVSCFPLGLASDPVTSELQIYPNPFQDEIRVHAASNIHSLTLFNSTGQVIWQKEIVSGHDASIPTQTLPSGFYWVQVDEQRPHSLIK